MTLPLLLAAGLAIFVIGNIARVVRTLRMPRGIRWELYPLPKGSPERQSYGGSYFEETEWWTKREKKSRLGELRFVLSEVLTLRGVRENFPALWPWSMALHWGLYLYGGALALKLSRRLTHMTAMADAGDLLFKLGCALGIIGVTGLLIARLIHTRLRPFTTRSAVFNLFFLLAVFVSGAFVVAYTPPPGTCLRPRFTTAQSVHFTILAGFLAYFPFTHLTHMYMKYFTWHRVRWDDEPAMHHPAHERHLTANLTRPVSWHAAHIAGTGAKTWADAVTQNPASEVPRA